MNIPVGIQADYRSINVLANGREGDVHSCVNGHPIGVKCVGKSFIESHPSGWRYRLPEDFRPGLACRSCYAAASRFVG